MSAWLNEHQVTHVVMESTGEYWKPIYNILEENFELLLVNFDKEQCALINDQQE